MNDRPAPEKVDPTNCDREPIHIPGAVQPHGVLFAFTEERFEVVNVSSNLPQFAPLQPGDMLGRSLADVFEPCSAAALRAALDETGATVGSLIPVRFAAGGAESVGSIHRHDGLTFVELERQEHDASDAHDFFGRTSGAIKRLQAAQTLESACAAAAAEVRKITGFDRVKVYRFADDFSGQVIAEDRDQAVESFLGLHFPPSDIPAQARKLYCLNPLRVIPDIDYVPAPIVPNLNPLNGQPIDLSLSVLRSVSPIHLEYMRNIGMRGSMSISIMRGERLWGLIACHNREPRQAGPDARQAAEMIAQVLAWQIGVMEEEAVTSQTLKGKAIQRSLISDIEQLHDHRAGLVRNSAALLELMGASGLCLHSREGVTTLGATPPEAAIERLVNVLGRAEGTELFQTDRLSALLPEAAAYADVASGVLAVPLSRSPPRRVMLWFRPEVAQTVRWAGDPDKPVTNVEGELRLSPRKSFAAWTEETRGRAIPWQSHEIAAAVEIRDLVTGVILRNTEKLERVNSQLARSNEELEAFAHVASHDIKEPLRHIEAFAGMLGESIRPLGDERLSNLVGGIESSSRRLRNLIKDLAEFSQVGRRAKPLASASLQQIAEEVVADLHQRIEETAATVEIGALPDVHCDHNQMRQVLQNLLSNAVKYRHPDRPCHIRIFTATLGEDERRSDAAQGAATRICISDNGIGFDPKYAGQIFEPFQRLHGPDAYEGSGIGLAICRKIVQRHGGAVGVETSPGLGSTFWFTLATPPETRTQAPERSQP
ncbi:light-regulated signal transduction histidine kinase (bacteriophytochrome) [Rhodoblastus acidophilus]|uniref:ATP-binding protein n=1 Tax=Rhodoblastus acidophilus TaxID=1074 RepID=UPI00222528C6|nr:ATP-binding protein [Rhodoblastus acidophilus]MCW2286778.1 light-regulated signal transduction histidine kinase (bacteriophytochrome) [Rhodoblastus acidophilus]MCW2335616.1 light-regulated signal transduction histidine kinase (bacteriophytochrome) [Rhodoblastus acidophilus]